MATTTPKRKSAAFKKMLEIFRQLPRTEQRQLLDELTQAVQVYSVRPNPSQEAIQRGQRLAEQVRAELRTSMAGSLNETMASLRGRSWS